LKKLQEKIMKKSTLFAVILILFVTVSVLSQSQNPDRPTPIISNEVTKNVSAGDTNQYFYSFVAGPGTLTITAEIKGVERSQVVYFELLEKNGADDISGSSGYAQTGDGGNMTREIVNVKIDKRRTILLKVTPQPLLENAQYRIRLSGSAISNDQIKVDKKPIATTNNGKRESGESVKVPAKGILVIKMKNGSTKEIDLSLVREILIEQ
jgi:hypothetical protein